MPTNRCPSTRWKRDVPLVDTGPADVSEKRNPCHVTNTLLPSVGGAAPCRSSTTFPPSVIEISAIHIWLKVFNARDSTLSAVGQT